MTFAELQEKTGPQDQADWKQHSNGDGWVHKTATVATSAYVGENAIIHSGDAWVFGNAQVSGDAWVFGDAWVSGNARVSGDAQVFGNAQVSGDAWVSGNAQVFGDAQVSGNARVFGDAWVFGNAWEKSPLFIVGSKHSLTNAKYGHIQIGCHCQPITWWVENYEEVGKKEGYTEAEIKEYGAYIDLFQKVGR